MWTSWTGAPVVKSIRKHTNAFLDCHLMVSDPDKPAPPSIHFIMRHRVIGFHGSLLDDAGKTIESIRTSGMKVGIAIKPGTPVETIMPLAALVDMVLVMTVEPGFGGQTLLLDCLEKVRQLRQTHPELLIQVDGGVTLENLPLVIEAGANVVVAGTLIFSSPDPANVISKMREASRSDVTKNP
ncbi:Ribulose-phosphate 3-epimerase [Paramicrosporidium saccamoebae]|uniref:Ribulose-phosphate 3-epimerase n=1 Tax=Paramicrosporidium saccamoebae TaxID=1246581 RepID=A0A2H9THL7_9FUNG|nr:Ribulose-phosphate 3-epimerase [Paramicrosporidium saccamoebae]